MGDVHPQGNPHYWLDPANGRRMAAAIRDKLSELSRGDAAYFAERFTDFDRHLAEAEKRWDAAMAPYKGLEVVTYHRSWPNFCERFGLQVIGYVEPRPGIPPSPGHVLDLVEEMRAKNVKLLLVEPYFDLKTPQKVSRETEAKVLVLFPSVGGEKGIDTYIDLFDRDIELLTQAIRETGATPPPLR
jgi:zinc/manganese transport system substrate-binding protein